MRFFAPTFLIATGAFVLWYNGNNPGSVMMLPFLDSVFPSLKGDPDAVGRMSAIFFFGLGGLLLVTSVIRQVSRSSQ